MRAHPESAPEPGSLGVFPEPEEVHAGAPQCAPDAHPSALPIGMGEPREELSSSTHTHTCEAGTPTTDDESSSTPGTEDPEVAAMSASTDPILQKLAELALARRSPPAEAPRLSTFVPNPAIGNLREGARRPPRPLGAIPGPNPLPYPSIALRAV